ncbi:LysR family transcriptional regulator [Streptococcus tangpeifui]|uniref:LysR family transcriptional regulator n=1 Tax=Streptococcus tangpeifui TaxID=2709400 RepID=UPI0013EA9ABD|nr:LysR family transcriptional regulator [Streptococcus sp. ZJ1593]
MEIKDIEYVKTIIDYGSITKAAKALYITQPSLSIYIKNMQQRLGFDVFYQRGKKLELTYLGEEFLKYGLQILRIQENFNDTVQNALNNKFGRLRLAIPLLRSSYLVPELLPKFHKEFPNVDIQLNESSSASFPYLIENGNVDLALMNRTQESHFLEIKKIKSEEILIALPAKHHLVGQSHLKKEGDYPSLSLDLLADELFILHQPDQFSRHISDNIFLENHFQPKQVLQTRNIETAANLVANNLGVCFINASHTKHLNDNAKIKFFSLEQKVYVDLVVAYRKNRQLPSFAKAFIEICKHSI